MNSRPLVETGDVFHLLLVGTGTRIDDVASTLERVFAGSTVDTQATAAAALDRIDDAHCVLVDRDLPDMALEAFLETVNRRGASVPVLLVVGRDTAVEDVLAGSVSDDESAVGPPAGVTDVVRVGDPPSVVARRVRTAIDAARAQSAAPGEAEWYRSVLEQSAALVAVVDRAGDVEYVSPAVERVSGYTPDEIERRGLSRLLYPDDRDRAREAFDAVVDGPLGATHRDTYRIRHADATWHVHDVEFVNRVTDPVVEGVLLTIRGVVPVAQVDSTMTGALDRIDEPVFALGDDWALTYANDACGSLFDRDAADAVGTVVWDVLPEAVRATVYERLHEARRSGAPVAFELRYPTTGAWLAVRVYPAGDELTVVARDETGRKGAEAEIRDTLDRQERIAAFGRRALTEPDADVIVHRAVTLLDELYDAAGVALFERVGSSLVTRSGVAIPPGVEVSLESSTLVARAFHADEPVALEVPTAASESDPLTDAGESALVVALGSPTPWGVLGVATAEQRTFSPDDLAALEQVGRLLDDALYGVARPQDDEGRPAAIDVLRTVAGDLLEVGTTIDACRLVAEEARQLFDADAAGVFLADREDGNRGSDVNRGDEGGERRFEGEGGERGPEGEGDGRLGDRAVPALQSVAIAPDPADSLGGRFDGVADAGAIERAFESGTATRVDAGDVPQIGSHPPSSGLVAPIDDRGVFVVTSAVPGAFDEDDLHVCELLASIVATTIERVDAEATARDHARTLHRERRRYERLRTLVHRLRAISRELSRANTREAIERVVCEELSSLSWLSLVWIGEGNVTTGEVVPRVSAGGASDYLDAVDVTIDDDQGEPAGQTAATGEATVRANVVSEARELSWRREALSRRLQSIASVPITYEEYRYGVLAVYAPDPGAMDEVTVALLSALGEVLAVAMNAVDVKRSVRLDGVVELELETSEPDDPVAHLATVIDRRIELERAIPRADGRSQVFFTVHDAGLDDVAAVAQEVDGIDAVRPVDEDGATLVEVTVSRPTLASVIQDHGGVVRRLTVGPRGTTAVVERPAGTPVRPFVDALRERFPGLELVARRERDGPVRARRDFREELDDELTDQQRRALEAAYFGGFFEWPRQSTGEEVAQSLGVSQPTFNRHYRAAERTLFTLLFEEGPESE